jgi:hypothetical protein
MAGRRLRKSLHDYIASSGMVSPDQEIFITIAGLSNSYSHYVTTYEEYQAQRYEAASTLYGTVPCPSPSLLTRPCRRSQHSCRLPTRVRSSCR